jgi:hypothetical protein
VTIDPVTLTGEEVAELRRMLVFITLGGLSPRAAHSAWAKLGLNNDIRVSAVAAGSLPPAPEEEDCMCGHPRSQHWGDAPLVACHQSMPPFGEDGSGETCGCWNYVWPDKWTPAPATAASTTSTRGERRCRVCGASAASSGTRRRSSTFALGASAAGTNSTTSTSRVESATRRATTPPGSPRVGRSTRSRGSTCCLPPVCGGRCA